MKITYLGHACFLMETRDGVKILTDPYTKVGYELPKGMTADIVLISHGHFDHNYIAAVEGDPIVIDKPGEHEAYGVKIKGENGWHDPKQGALRGANVMFRIEADGTSVCHFGDLGEDLSAVSKKTVFDADVWLIPVGGTYTIDSAQAWRYVEAFKPKFVIPMHYRPSDGGLDIADVSEFLQKAESVTAYKNGQWQIAEAECENKETRIIYMERYKA